MSSCRSLTTVLQDSPLSRFTDFGSDLRHKSFATLPVNRKSILISISQDASNAARSSSSNTSYTALLLRITSSSTLRITHFGRATPPLFQGARLSIHFPSFRSLIALISIHHEVHLPSLRPCALLDCLCIFRSRGCSQPCRA